ncbi:MAG: PAS domain S-box protein [Desulfobacteraceae bacterium]|nr:PAS domain S-box protein [Desulfobacteraceae bacterium]
MGAPAKPEQSGRSDDGLMRGKLKKLLLFRLMLAVFFLALTLAVQGHRNEDLLGAKLLPLYVFSCILFLFTIIGSLSLQRFKSLVGFAWCQLLFDIGAVTVLVYLSGGIESPFAFLYLLVIVSSALLLYRRGSLLTASACSLTYGLLLDLQYFGWISPLRIVDESAQARHSGVYFFNLLIYIAGFYLVGFLAGYLAEELLKSSRTVRERDRDLRHLGALHRSIVESMTSGLLTIDLQGRIMFSNTAGQEILGLDRGRIEGHSLDGLFASVAVPQLPPGALAQGRSPANRAETLYIHPSGRTMSIGYSHSLLTNETGEPSGWVFIFRDLTRIKEMEEHIQRTEHLALAGKFAAEVAHEIKNPLAAMSGAVQMLREELNSEPIQSRLMGIVQREIARINELVTDFLWLAKGSPKPGEVETVQVCPAIEEILALLKAKNRITSSHAIRTDFRDRPSLLFDPNRLRQILWNLFLNALEAMPEGGELLIAASVEGINESETSVARIDIGDTGCGIAEEVKGRIFDPFFTTKGSGTGLGLSIVYRLVQESGGRIEVNPRPSGNGTVVSLFFPRQILFSCQMSSG